MAERLIIMERNNIIVVGKFIGLIKPLLPWMLVAIILEVLGFLSSIGLTVLGGYSILNILGMETTRLTLESLFITIILLAILRGVLRYGEQASNHYIAFKILALIRDKVFKALRRLAPAKLEGKDKGNLISLITTDIELLEVFYAHTISPVVIAFVVSLIMIIFISQIHFVLGIIAFIGYLTVGILIPVLTSKIGKKTGREYREEFGYMNSYFLDNLRGMRDIIQFGFGKAREKGIRSRTEALEEKHKQLKEYEGVTTAITNSVIIIITLLMFSMSIWLYSSGINNFSGVLLAIIAVMSSFGPVVALANLGNNLLQTFASGNRILNIFEEEPIVEDVVNGLDLDFKGVNCSDVGFAYNTKTVLENISM